MTDPRWLDDTQSVAWRGLMAIVNRAIPEIERSLKTHGLLGVHYHIFVELSAAPGRTLRLSGARRFGQPVAEPPDPPPAPAGRAR